MTDALAMPPIFTPKIIFFDIDDTLCRDGKLAPHNKETLEALATHTDIKLAIATGRSRSLLPEDILDLLDKQVFDAIVCTNGQYNFTKQELVSHYPLTLAQAKKIDALCQQDHLMHKFDSAKHLAWVTDNEKTRASLALYPSAIIDPNYYKTNIVYQCSVFFYDAKDKMQDIDFAEYGLKLVYWHRVGGDILPIDASKARGVADICQYFNINIEDAMAVGDGFNDIEMFEAVGFSVAMGDSESELIQIANFVTGTIEEHGIQNVLHPLLPE